MDISKLTHIPLVRAYLCQDCESVGNSSRACPACASGALISLSAIVNGVVKQSNTPPDWWDGFLAERMANHASTSDIL